MKKNFVLLFILLAIPSFSASIMFEQELQETYITIGAGLSYNFNFNADLDSGTEIAFFDAPLALGVGFRIRRFLSIHTGIHTLYSYHNYKHKGGEIEQHSLLLDLPFELKFYPFAAREATHYHFAIGVGLFARFWPLNHITMTKNDEQYSFNAYTPTTTSIFPGDSYAIANVGTSVTLGNTFMFNERVGGGLELGLRYLFLPYINGYASKSPYRYAGKNPYLYFNGSIGFRAYLQFIISGSTIQVIKDY